MNKILLTSGLALLCVVAGACSRKDYTGERRYPLSGKITVDGQPMESGVISFLPQDQGRVSGGPIKGGSYSVSEAAGATAGKYRVEVHWNKPTGRRVRDAYGEEIMDEYKEGLPDKYHKSSELTADVSSKQSTFDFNLQSK